MVKITLTHFTPAQAEKITGVSVDQQRNLRRHGYLPQAEGHARFDGFALARLTAIKALSDRGIGPAMIAKAVDASDIASFCAIGILWSLLDGVDAYEGDHKTFATPWPASPARQELIEQMVMAGFPEREIKERDASDWPERSEWLKKQVLSKMGARRIIPARFFIWWADGTHSWEMTIDQAFSDVSRSDRYQGAVIILDQDALASGLQDRAGAAFAHIEDEEP